MSPEKKVIQATGHRLPVLILLATQGQRQRDMKLGGEVAAVCGALSYRVPPEEAAGGGAHLGSAPHHIVVRSYLPSVVL
jgi:hypothetical protein